MKTFVMGGEKISREQLMEDIKDIDQGVQYLVEGVSFRHLCGEEMESINELFLDEAVEDGHLLMDVSYSFYGANDGEATVIVTVADVSEWVGEEV